MLSASGRSVAIFNRMSGRASPIEPPTWIVPTRVSTASRTSSLRKQMHAELCGSPLASSSARLILLRTGETKVASHNTIRAFPARAPCHRSSSLPIPTSGRKRWDTTRKTAIVSASKEGRRTMTVLRSLTSTNIESAEARKRPLEIGLSRQKISFLESADQVLDSPKHHSTPSYDLPRPGELNIVKRALRNE